MFDMKAYMRVYNQTIKHKDYQQRWYLKNKERIKEKTKTWRKNNKEHAQKLYRAYNSTPKRIAYQKVYIKLRAKTAQFKLNHSAAALLIRLPGTSVATRKEIVRCKKLIKTLRGDK